MYFIYNDLRLKVFMNLLSIFSEVIPVHIVVNPTRNGHLKMAGKTNYKKISSANQLLSLPISYVLQWFPLPWPTAYITCIFHLYLLIFHILLYYYKDDMQIYFS